MIETRRLGKNELWWSSESEHGHPDEPASAQEIERSLRGQFRWVQSSEGSSGLRPPQIGALHAILAAESIEEDYPGTVVLPTGTGKTETMLAAYCNAPKRTLILVPSDSLRTQIATKFATLGVLPKVGALSGPYLTPRVGVIRAGLTSIESTAELLREANVLVATVAALHRSSGEALAVLASGIRQVFVDEAHHVPARTWAQITSAFTKQSTIQFTATPFREDGIVLSGRLIYAYPLRLAQRNGWFAKINYSAVAAADEVDRALASIAVDRLRSDLEVGFDHVMMARVNSVRRASEVLSIYEEIAADLQPIRIDSKLSLSRQRKAKSQISARQTRLVICVDMLGEGFDLPELKVAAVHDPHKSLAVTLQFVGRFARAGKSQLGEASIFVPRSIGVRDDRLRRLYAEDADWNVVIREITHEQVGNEAERSRFEAGFKQLPTEISIRTIRPKMSTVVFRSQDLSWNPDGVYEVFEEVALLTKRIAVNEEDRVAWFITSEESPVRWSDFTTLTETMHHLYIVHVDQDAGLLFINSSDTSAVHEELARAIGGATANLISGDVVYRVLSPINRRIPTNVGLLDAVNRNRRFTMHVGADVLEGFGPGAAQKAKTNIFAHGYTGSSHVSIGASRKGRVWSHRVAHGVHEWVRWAREVGEVMIDDSVDIRSVMSGFIIPEAAVQRPRLVPLGIDWPHDLGFGVSESREITYGGTTQPLIDVEFEVLTRSRTDPIEFDVSSHDWKLRYLLSFDSQGPVVTAIDEDATVSLPRGDEVSLSRFMTQRGLTVYFEQEALLSPDGYFLQPDRARPRFPTDRLEVLDWSGVNIRRESQGPDRQSDTVQFHVAERVMREADWEFVLDDDGTGEIADLVAIRREQGRLELLLVHCKYSSGATPGARVGDLYEVCGQAMKCHKAKSGVEVVLRRALRRENARQSKGLDGCLVGSRDTLQEILSDCWRLDPMVTVMISQPGLSKAAMSLDQSEILGCTELYLSETYGTRFRVQCSA